MTRLHAEITKALQVAAVREKARVTGLDVEEPNTPKEMRKRMAEETRAWAEIYTKTGIHPAP